MIECCKKVIYQPERRSRLIFELDSTVVTVFGKQDGAEIGYNPSIGASVATTRCYVWRPIVIVVSGTQKCAVGTPAPGKVVLVCWRLPLRTCRPKVDNCGFVPMPVLRTTVVRRWSRASMSFVKISR